jgi:hypothetical protein
LTSNARESMEMSSMTDDEDGGDIEEAFNAQKREVPLRVLVCGHRFKRAIVA